MGVLSTLQKGKEILDDSETQYEDELCPFNQTYHTGSQEQSHEPSHIRC